MSTFIRHLELVEFENHVRAIVYELGDCDDHWFVYDIMETDDLSRMRKHLNYLNSIKAKASYADAEWKNNKTERNTITWRQMLNLAVKNMERSEW